MNSMKIFPKNSISGIVNVPSSKSYVQRAIALASLSETTVTIQNLSNSEDSLAAQGVVSSLGAEFTAANGTFHLTNGIAKNLTNNISINCKESGLSTRLFSAFSLLFKQSFQVNGEGSITQRTMEMVIEGLEKFGKQIKSIDSKLPLIIEGEASKYEIEIDGSLSSQFLTGLLIVAPFLKADTEIRVLNLKSIPYIEMTIDLINHFGLEVENNDFKVFNIKGNQRIISPVEYRVEGDWSAASFHVVAAAIGGSLKLTGLMKDSRQGDKAILEAVKLAGAKISWINNDLFIEKSDLIPFEFDANECPDLFPPLVVLASYAKGKTVIKGLKRLKHKESDRGVTLQEECAKIGVKIDLLDDEMIIYGIGHLDISKEIIFSSHNDHRIAMAMSLFSIGAKSPIYIQESQAIDKSYPDFYIDFLTI